MTITKSVTRLVAAVHITQSWAPTACYSCNTFCTDTVTVTCRAIDRAFLTSISGTKISLCAFWTISTWIATTTFFTVVKITFLVTLFSCPTLFTPTYARSSSCADAVNTVVVTFHITVGTVVPVFALRTHTIVYATWTVTSTDTRTRHIAMSSVVSSRTGLTKSCIVAIVCTAINTWLIAVNSEFSSLTSVTIRTGISRFTWQTCSVDMITVVMTNCRTTVTTVITIPPCRTLGAFVSAITSFAPISAMSFINGANRRYTSLGTKLPTFLPIGSWLATCKNWKN